ncbi:MAG: hypothetical protein WBW34_02490 [Nitrososphaeraceae archaeon]
MISILNETDAFVSWGTIIKNSESLFTSATAARSPLTVKSPAPTVPPWYVLPFDSTTINKLIIIHHKDEIVNRDI